MADVLASGVPTVGASQMVTGTVPSAQQKACLEQLGGSVSLHTVSVSAVYILSTSVSLQCSICKTYCFSAPQTGERLEAQHQRCPGETALQY
jgi:hypothetical protein